MSYIEKMLVVGAGPVGLAVAKGLKQRGIPYDHVEADDAVGGNWYHGVFESTHIISSRKTTEFADYPMPETYPEFPSCHQILEYLTNFANEFGLVDLIEFETKVVAARPCENDRWEVALDSGEKRIYKGVIACTGHHWDRLWPEYPGEFTGRWIHSKDYKSPEELRGKRVLVIGGGNSACDVATDAARVAKSAHISMRNGHWFLPKTLMGVPTVEILRPWMSMPIQRLVLRILLKAAVGDYRNYGLQRPHDRIFDRHPTINSELLQFLKEGRVKPLPGVHALDGDAIEFEDGRREKFDIVVCATGFHVSFPYLPEGLVEVRNAVPQLHAGSAPTNYKNIYIVGSLQVRYGFGPVLTPYADLLCDMIELQELMTLPVGRVAKSLGDRIPKSASFDPFQALRTIRLARKALPLVLLRDKQLRRKTGDFNNEPLPFPRLSTPESKVF